ncbi:hypothetical protein GEOBRER4_n1103 [Citrifermentans bremense]|uniref:Uncharacterized protein n=1 Tax=Citrifermentans bremense TaxID=60035 RepID=A0A7R7IYN6_9BACT|nr:hypothetical protein GEOBRER4_n1103 [Citrifermentans bremense]
MPAPAPWIFGYDSGHLFQNRELGWSSGSRNKSFFFRRGSADGCLGRV